MHPPSPIYFWLAVSLGIHLTAWMLLPDSILERNLDLRWSGGRGDGTVVMVGFAPFADDGWNSSTPVVAETSATTPVAAQETVPFGAPPHVSRRKPGARAIAKEDTPRKKPHREKKKPRGGESAMDSGMGDSPTPAGGVGDGLDAGGVVASDAPNILAKIRREIARRQHYPESARTQKLKGTVKVDFRINTDGKLAYVTVAASSGHAILDSAAVSTVKKAAPFPYYPRPITLSLEYRLEVGR